MVTTVPPGRPLAYIRRPIFVSASVRNVICDHITKHGENNYRLRVARIELQQYTCIHTVMKLYFIYVFIYGLFNDAVIISDYTAWSDRMINK
jgi:hypothetical protein